MGTTSPMTTINAEGARNAIDAARAQANTMGVPVCITVVDAAGRLLAFERMDGAATLSIQLSQDKAYTVISFNGQPTDEWFDMIKDEPPLLHGIVKADRLMIFGGGRPIIVGGELIGAIGCSGGSAEEDVAIASAGAAALA